MKKILIAGAAGFIGSHLCDFFIKKGYQVIGLDNLSTGRIENIAHLINNYNFSFLNQDINNLNVIEEKLDFILHFASPASPIDFRLKPFEILNCGSVGTQNLFDLALKNDALILLASSSEVYGNPLQHPQTEEYIGNVNSFGERSVYDESKRFSESLAYAHIRYKNCNVRIARIFNTYGPRMRINDGRAVPNFINQLISNKDFTVYGNGNQTRSFCYINDLVDGIYKLLLSKYNKPINLGNPNEISINELVIKIKNLAKNNLKIIYKKLPADDPIMRKPNIEKANNILNWRPIIKLEDGLKKTYNYMIKENNA